MRNIKPAMFVLLFSLTQPAQAEERLNAAFEDARQFSNSKLTEIFEGIKEEAIADKIPHYGIQPSETQFFQNGQGELSEPGITKLQDCAAYVPGNDPIANQECDAINFLAKNPQIRKQVPPIAPDDPMIVTTRNIRNNAQTAFQSMGINKEENACTVHDETIPGQYKLKSCTSIKQVTINSCVVNRLSSSGGFDLSACLSLDNNPSCQFLGSECTSTTPPVPPPEGEKAPQACYQESRSYGCLTGFEDNSECSLLTASGNCTLQSTEPCSAEDRINGTCTIVTRNYNCEQSAPQTRQYMDCSGRRICLNGNCFDNSYPPDEDFAKSISFVEMARQAGVYLDGEALHVLDGVPEKCRIKVGGLSNCCASSGGGTGYQNNLLFNITGQVGKNVFSYGSKYLYDALYTSVAPDWMVKGMSAMYSVDPLKIPAGGLLSTFSPTLRLYGFTATTGELAPGFVSEFLGGEIIAFEGLGLGGLQFGFDPYSFAIQVAIMVVMELLSCDTKEQILSVRKGENLCHRVGSYCSKKVFGICLERKRSYCCYNSRLSRIINVQGREQIQKGWGSAKNPECTGFTPEEFAAIDFSKLDLTEFAPEVLQSVKVPNASILSEDAEAVINQKVRDYYDYGTQTIKK
ncbi:MAG: conjugal transfer protein TraN [Nitrosomonas sp.]|nr:conjugal transfer protein TraN [Nitrosomonas sp.]